MVTISDPLGLDLRGEGAVVVAVADGTDRAAYQHRSVRGVTGDSAFVGTGGTPESAGCLRAALPWW
ncbi:MAG: hypothetical protein K0S98_416 [Propionibacteriaceae bacterium]|jgi:hypothetical protein|nr:hypothetical protein [Propionibacteriaceae bacterium]